MKRLTNDNEDFPCANKSGTSCHENTIGVLNDCGYCNNAIAVMKRLQAYEQTGLTPKQVKHIKDEGIDEIIIRAFSEQPLRRYVPGERVPKGWYWVQREKFKPCIVEFDHELREKWLLNPGEGLIAAIGPIPEPEEV